MIKNKYISLIGLGAVGAPLSKLLYKKFGDDFTLLSSKEILPLLTNKDIFINGELFAPKIISEPKQLDKKIAVLFICVKNYHIYSTVEFLKDMIDRDTVIVPLQNGVFSFEYCSETFPENCVLEGFAKGPNTTITDDGFIYERPGTFYIGSSIELRKKIAYEVYELMLSAGIDCYYDDDIKHEIWKKLMLNVAGNSITAITQIDYCMFSKSIEVQNLCRKVMREFVQVAKKRGINLTEEDIEDVIQYYLSFSVSKHTSMLEDVLNHRQTENEYIAGYICKLAKDFLIPIPNIDMLYNLVKIKEDVYLGNI